jgi:hypothetical protein
MNYSDLQNNIAKNDGIEKARIGQTRKVKLTLKHLNKLRKIRELKNLEKLNMAKQLELIYATPAEEPQL